MYSRAFFFLNNKKLENCDFFGVWYTGYTHHFCGGKSVGKISHQPILFEFLARLPLLCLVICYLQQQLYLDVGLIRLCIYYLGVVQFILASKPPVEEEEETYLFFNYLLLVDCPPYIHPWLRHPPLNWSYGASSHIIPCMRTRRHRRASR